MSLTSNDIHVDVAAFLEQIVNDCPPEQSLPPRYRRLADHDLRDISRARQIQKGIRDFIPHQSVSLCSQLLGQPEVAGDLPAVVPPLVAARFHSDRQPFAAEGGRHPFGSPY